MSAPQSAGSAWACVVNEIEIVKPHFAGCAKESAEFAAAWSGGDDAPGLADAEAYAKSLKVRKEPEDGQLGILAKAQLKRAPMLPIACLKTLSQAPDLMLEGSTRSSTQERGASAGSALPG